MSMFIVILFTFLSFYNVNASFTYKIPSYEHGHKVANQNVTSYTEFLPDAACNVNLANEVTESTYYMGNYLLDPYSLAINVAWSILQPESSFLDYCYAYHNGDTEECYKNFKVFNASAADNIHYALKALNEVNATQSLSQQLIQTIVCSACSGSNIALKPYVPPEVFSELRKIPNENIEKMLAFSKDTKFRIVISFRGTTLRNVARWGLLAKRDTFYMPYVTRITLQYLIPTPYDVRFYSGILATMNVKPYDNASKVFTDCWNIQKVDFPKAADFSSYDYNTFYAISKYYPYLILNFTKYDTNATNYDEFMDKCVPPYVRYPSFDDNFYRHFLHMFRYFKDFTGSTSAGEYNLLSYLRQAANFTNLSEDTLQSVYTLQNTFKEYSTALYETNAYFYCDMIYNNRINVSLSLDGCKAVSKIDEIFPVFINDAASVIYKFKGKFTPIKQLYVVPEFPVALMTLSNIVGANASHQDIVDYLTDVLSPGKYDLMSIYSYFNTLGSPIALKNSINGLKPQIANLWGIGSEYLVGKVKVTMLPPLYTAPKLSYYGDMNAAFIAIIVILIVVIALIIFVIVMRCVMKKSSKKKYDKVPVTV